MADKLKNINDFLLDVQKNQVPKTWTNTNSFLGLRLKSLPEDLPELKIKEFQ